VRAYLGRLQSTPEAAGEAFRELWEAPPAILPALILEAQNDRPSGLKDLTILVIDKQRFLSVDEEGNCLYDIPGLRGVKYDDIVVGNAPRGLKVVLRRLKQPFPVGVVVRAALINRFRSPDVPAGDDAANPVRWWQEFYERRKARL
jgi:hypothetical protein